MLLKTMEVTYLTEGGVFRIDFDFNLSYAKVIDLVTFIKGTELKFNGRIEKVHRFWRETGKAFGAVRVQFEDLTHYTDAKEYCGAHLTEAGRVKSSYAGALDHIDPRRILSQKLLAEIKAAPYSN